MSLTKLNNRSMSAITRAGLPAIAASDVPTLTTSNLPAGALINTYTVDARFAEVNITSSSYVSVHSDLTFNYTPVLTSSKIYVVAEMSASPHNNTGGASAGGGWAIFLNGVQYGRQTAAHEYYVHVGTGNAPDLYIGHTIKTVIFTNTNGNALGIDIKGRSYTPAGTSHWRFNQGNQWNSLVHVYEYKT